MWSQHIDFHGGGDANLRKAKLIFLLAALAAAALFSCAVSESPASSDSGLVSMFREKLTEEAELHPLIIRRFCRPASTTTQPYIG